MVPPAAGRQSLCEPDGPNWMFKESSLDDEGSGASAAGPDSEEPAAMGAKWMRNRSATMWSKNATSDSTTDTTPVGADKLSPGSPGSPLEDAFARAIMRVDGTSATSPEGDSSTAITVTSKGSKPSAGPSAAADDTEGSSEEFSDVVVLRRKPTRTIPARGDGAISMYAPPVRGSRFSVSMRESQFGGPNVRHSLFLEMDKDVNVDESEPRRPRSGTRRMSAATPLADPRLKGRVLGPEDIARAHRLASARRVRLPPRLMQTLLPVDRLVLGKRLASNYFGNVYDASLYPTEERSPGDSDGYEDAAGDDKPVVVNVLTQDIDAKLCQSYLNEASVLLTMQHPNVLRVFGVYVEPTMIGVLYESLPMTSVRDWLLQLRQTSTCDWKTALPVIIDIRLALIVNSEFSALFPCCSKMILI